MKPVLSFGRAHWRALGLVVMLAFLAALLLWPKPTPTASVLVLAKPFRAPVTLRERMDRCLPARPAFIWRAEQALFGKRRPVDLFFDIRQWAGSPQTDPALLALGTPALVNSSPTNQLHVWFLDATAMRALRARWQAPSKTALWSRPRIHTADGVYSSLLQNQTLLINGVSCRTGLTVDCVAGVHAASVDLVTSILLSEPIFAPTPPATTNFPPVAIAVQTNLDLALRLQLPRGKGFFLLGGPPAAPIGILLDPPQAEPPPGQAR